MRMTNGVVAALLAAPEAISPPNQFDGSDRCWSETQFAARSVPKMQDEFPAVLITAWRASPLVPEKQTNHLECGGNFSDKPNRAACRRKSPISIQSVAVTLGRVVQLIKLRHPPAVHRRSNGTRMEYRAAISSRRNRFYEPIRGDVTSPFQPAKLPNNPHNSSYHRKKQAGWNA